MAKKNYVIKEEDYEVAVVKYKHALNKATAEIDNILDDVTRNAGRRVVYYTDTRIKTQKSLEEKCNRKDLPADKIEDIAGAKIVVLFKDDLELVCELLRSAFAVIKEDNYLETAKDNGYRAVHLTVKIQTTVNQRQVQVPIEIQVKTALADALWSMEHVVKYKNSTPDPEAGDIITAAASRIDGLDQDMIKFRNYGNQQKTRE